MNRFLMISMIALFFLGSSFNKLAAQHYEWLADDFPGSLFRGVHEINEKYYGSISNAEKYDTNVDYKLNLYSIDFINTSEAGINLQEVISLAFQEHYSTLALEYIEATGMWLLVQSAFIAEGEQRFRVILCNNNFEILAQQSMDILGYPLGFDIDSDNFKTSILGFILGPPAHKLFYFQYNHSNPLELPQIIVGQSEPKETFLVTSMKLDSISGNMLVFSSDGISILDSNLFQVQNYEYAQILTHIHGHVIGAGNYYYSHGANQDWDTGYKRLVFHKYDSSFNILSADTLGWPGQDNYPFINQSIDCRNNEIIVGGHLDGPSNPGDTFKKIKKYYLAKYDNDLNRIWYKEYGGDKAYWFLGLHLLEDGGALAYGYITDTLDDLRYGYIMHVDASGEILTSSKFSPLTQNSIKVLNPGEETFCVINPEQISAMISLYDLNGNRILNSNIQSSCSEFSVVGLSTGVYPYFIHKDGRLISSGKWMKVK